LNLNYRWSWDNYTIVKVGPSGIGTVFPGMLYGAEEGFVIFGELRTTYFATGRPREEHL
jgi:hypothetical protein